jgi:hypothetical protein
LNPESPKPLSWSELKRLALVGLNRSEWQGPAGQAPEAQLLEELARQALRRRAGWQPQPLAAEQVPSEPAPEDALPWAGPEASQLLEPLLSGRHPALLREWLRLAVAEGQLVRPVYLPKLLSLASQVELPQELLLASVGERGAWLAKQHPQWRELVPPEEAIWERGTRAERARYLTHLRSQDAGAARQRLADCLETATFRELAALLPALQIQLSADDLPLLEPLASHSRKEVRQVVLPLLAQLADSQLVQAATARATQWLRREGEDLQVKLPTAQAVKSAAAYQPRPAGAGAGFEQWRRGLGERAQAQVRELSLVPPSYWCEHLGESPEKLLRRLPYHPWGMTLLRGWLLAALNHSDAAWAQAIFRLLLYPKHDPQLRGETGYDRWLPPGLRSALLELVPAAERDRLLAAAMPYVQLTAAPMPFWLLLHSPEPVSMPVAKAFAPKLFNLLQAGERQLSAQLRQFVQNMTGVAFVLPTGYFHELMSTWALNPAYPQWFDPQLEGVIQLMAFRHRLVKHFQ